MSYWSDEMPLIVGYPPVVNAKPWLGGAPPERTRSRSGPPSVLSLLATALIGCLLLSACGNGSLTEAERVSAEVAIYAAATRQLVEFDNTFGAGHRFSQILIVDHLHPDAGDTMQEGQSPDPFTDDQRSAIVAAIGHLGPITFISSQREFIRQDSLAPVIPGSAIIALDPAEFDSDGATVRVNLWCGRLCGTSITYRVVERADSWTITGKEGPWIIY